MDEIKSTFEKYDADGNGFITYNEAHQVMTVVLSYIMHQVLMVVL